MGKKVDYSAKDGIAFIELNDPPANAYGYDMMRDLDEAILEARMDEKVHVLILRGKGEKFFCGGADIRMLNEKSPTYFYYFSLHANETARRLEMTPKIVIAALNGHAMGGGLEVALACDFRLAKRDAGRVGLPEVNLGLEPGVGGTQRLPRIVGYAKAIELMTTGRAMTFEEALDIGLVHYVYEPATYWDEVQAFAQQFLPPNKAPKAAGRIKLAARASLETSISEGILIEHETLQQLYEAKDSREGVAAFLARRQAVYTGS
ncbi:MAG: enoyl-CoA hydratase [Acidobacteria bacterium RIFCSPLOWO2_02_FULL_59_13]|nr:MAG: enoyl-CoA hydratase [Acidobacteria bacterium RIFCSPLOWO2_02_FULL_59_13]